MEWDGRWYKDKKIPPEPDAARLLSEARAANLTMAEQIKAETAKRRTSERALAHAMNRLNETKRALDREKERSTFLARSMEEMRKGGQPEAPRPSMMTTEGIIGHLKSIEATTDAELMALIRRSQLMQTPERAALRRLIDGAKRKVARLVCGI